MRIILAALLCMVFSVVMSQNDSVPLNLKPRRILKVNPLYLLNRFPTIQLTYENHLSPKSNISIGAGYIMNMYDDSYNTDFNDRSGVKLNTDFRYYFEESKRVIFFMGVGVDYFYIKFNRSRTFGFNCMDDFSCLYFQYDTYNVIRQDWRINVKSGMIVNLGAKIYFETGFGLAISFQDYRTSGKIKGFDIQYGNNTLKEDGKRELYLPLPILQFGYRFR
ncbi:MAG TPA: hypothetical protein PKL31_04800 [Fulvivirga sp.]|nr:hypothetical protein [Fulvivirga sp.]